MEENVLKDFETFYEYPEKLLKIDNNCNVFALTLKEGDTYLAREKLSNIFTFNKKGFNAVYLKCEYYDIFDGSKITETESWYYLDKKYRLNKKNNNILLLNPFSEIFEIRKKSNRTSYLNIDQALYIIGKKRIKDDKLEEQVKQKVLEK